MLKSFLSIEILCVSALLCASLSIFKRLVKERYFKKIIEPDGKPYFYDSEGKPKFSFHGLDRPPVINWG